jgi:hypothetical protein
MLFDSTAYILFLSGESFAYALMLARDAVQVKSESHLDNISTSEFVLLTSAVGWDRRDDRGESAPAAPRFESTLQRKWHKVLSLDPSHTGCTRCLGGATGSG